MARDPFDLSEESSCRALRALFVTICLSLWAFPSALAQCVNVCVTPDGTSAAALPGSTGNAAVFTITNGFNFDQDYTLTCEAFAPVSSCAIQGTSYLDLGAGASAQKTVLYTASATSGAGTVRVKALQLAASAWIDYGLYFVAVGTPGPTLTPDGWQATAIQGSPGNTVTFTLTNHSAASRNYTFSCATYGRVFGCTPPGTVTGLAASASTTVTASYTGSALGTGSLTPIRWATTRSRSASVSASRNSDRFSVLNRL